MHLDIQYSSATNDWPVLRDAVRRAEHDGYDTAWVFDHFDGSTLNGDRPFLECFTLLGAMAAATSTIGIGPLVANVANRHPTVLAHAAAAVQRISGGRLRLGIGAGTAPGTRWATEHERRGIPLLPTMAERHAAVLASIAAVRDASDAPIVVGVNSPALAELAGQHADGVNVRLDHPRAAELCAVARATAGERPFEVSVYSLGERNEAEPAARALRADRLVLTRLGALS
jgi:alkanesulfonate monooxygenase SsuD/methylene tetrahydromethanopterin reductase-like flavin-dependent oxidoreductase (luciferase family)